MTAPTDVWVRGSADAEILKEYFDHSYRQCWKDILGSTFYVPIEQSKFL